MRISLASIGKSLAGRFKSMAALSLVFVFAVNVDAAHSHDDHGNHDDHDHHRSGEHFDCQACLKFGQDDDFNHSRAPDSASLPIDQIFTRVPLTAESVEIPPARSRSPPRA